MCNSRDNTVDAGYNLRIAGIMKKFNGLLYVTHFTGGDKILLSFYELVLKELGGPIQLKLFVYGD